MISAWGVAIATVASSGGFFVITFLRRTKLWLIGGLFLLVMGLALAGYQLSSATDAPTEDEISARGAICANDPAFYSLHRVQQ